MTGRIIKGVGGLYTVKTENGKIECKARGIFRKEKTTPLIGDRVVVENDVISEILPRKNSLIRPPCANIDKMFLVCAVADPEPNLYTLDKMLTLAVYHNIEPVLIFNKTDLDDKSKTIEIYKKLPIKHFCLSAKNDTNCVAEQIREEIKGHSVVLSGLSGVGKSTLMNLLNPSLCVETGEIGLHSQRGKHTTRHVELFEMFGGEVLDTPGFSNLLFEYFDLKDRQLLASCFPEFAPFTGKCRFADCSHTKEPDCEVIKAVNEGIIPKSRHENYCQLYDEIGPLEKWKDK